MSYMLSDRLISPRRERPQTGLLQSLFLLFLKNTFSWISPVKVVKVSFRNPSASSRLGQNPEIEVIQKVVCTLRILQGEFQVFLFYHRLSEGNRLFQNP